MWKKFVSGFLILVLTLSVPVFVFTYSARQTIMEKDFYLASFEKSGAYIEIRDGIIGLMEKGLSGYADKDEIMEDAKSIITQDYVKGEMERNAESLAGALSGKKDTVQIYLDFSKVREELETPDLPEKVDLTGGLNFNVDALNKIGKDIKNYMIVSLIISLLLLISLFFLNDIKLFLRGVGGSFVVSGFSFIPLMLFQKTMPSQMPDFMNALIADFLSYPKFIFIVFLAVGVIMLVASFFIKKKN